MTTSVALLILSIAACAWLAVMGIREHRDAMACRHRLLDEAAGLLSEAVLAIGPDQFPIATGRIADGRRVKIELIGDSMITRRLPQLWLRVTLHHTGKQRRPLIGALARPTGGEYYSLVHDMLEWMAPPKTNTSMLMRGDGSATPWQAEHVRSHFNTLFSDPAVKEAVISPNGVRIMRQAAQGERVSHLFLRQARFAITSVPAEDINTAIAMASALVEVLPDSELVPITEAA